MRFKPGQEVCWITKGPDGKVTGTTTGIISNAGRFNSTVRVPGYQGQFTIDNKDLQLVRKEKLKLI